MVISDQNLPCARGRREKTVGRLAQNMEEAGWLPHLASVCPAEDTGAADVPDASATTAGTLDKQESNRARLLRKAVATLKHDRPGEPPT